MLGLAMSPLAWQLDSELLATRGRCRRDGWTKKGRKEEGTQVKRVIDFLKAPYPSFGDVMSSHEKSDIFPRFFLFPPLSFPRSPLRHSAILFDNFSVWKLMIAR